MKARFATLSCAALLTLVSACSRADPAPELASESDVQVARCPADVKLQFGKPQVSKTAPTTRPDGFPLTAQERTRVDQVMARTRQLTGLDADLRLDRTTSGQCFYDGTKPGEGATFRTKDGNDIFQIFAADGLQLFAFPEAYDTTALAFEPNASASLFANVRASGPFADGASISVKIGRVAIKPAVGPELPATRTLKPGTNDAITDGPESIVLVAGAAGVSATVVTSWLARCTVTQESTSATETRFAIALEYEIDDGFNGCELSFDNAEGYHADIRVGLDVTD